MEPKVTIPNEASAVRKGDRRTSDLAYTLALEILPKIELADFKGIKLERQVAEVTRRKSMMRWGRSLNRIGRLPSKPKGESPKRRPHPHRTLPGRIDGAPSKVARARCGRQCRGPGTFLPGFEDQLVGMTVRNRRGEGHISRQLPEHATCGEKRRVRRHSEVARSGRPGYPRRCHSRSRWGWNLSTSPRRPVKGAAQEHAALSRRNLQAQAP